MASYVSPNQYAAYTCAQLQDEAQRISQHAIQVAGIQDSKATSDAIATGVGAVVFWPALFFIKGEGTSAPELARLKGEKEAIEQASIMKRCGIAFHDGRTASQSPQAAYQNGIVPVGVPTNTPYRRLAL